MRTCEALAVTCMDFRFQGLLEGWLQEHVGHGRYDRVAFAGAAKSRDVILSQVVLAKELHDIRRVIVINHEDCGAYGADGTLDLHTHDLQKMATAIQERYPDLEVELYYAALPTGDISQPSAHLTRIS